MKKELILKPDKHKKSSLGIIMRLKLILFIACFVPGMLCANQSFSQKIVSIHLSEVKLEALFEEIESKTGYAILYETNIPTSTIDVDMEKQSAEHILSEALKPFSLGYNIKGNQIIIIEDKLVKRTTLNKNSDKQQQQNNELTIKGVIKDKNDEVLVGASIQLKGSTKNAIADVNGKFVMSGVPKDGILVISYLGFDTQEIRINNRTEFTIVLEENIGMLEEVVVVGYGTQKKENLTGSVEVVTPDKLKDRPASNTSQLLQGTVPGMNFTYADTGAEPGAKLSLSIRGQGSPYVLIDGVAGDINMINPNDIENISVLKDAAASAIYGARAPYGVVLVTTKSGKNSSKLHIDFSSNVSFSKTIQKPKMVDSYTFVRAMNEMHDNQGVARLFGEAAVDRIIAYINDPSLPETVPNSTNPKKWNTYLDANGNNDWIDIHYGTGSRHQENLSLRGGSKSLAYFMSLGHTYDKGQLRYGTDNYRRINFNNKLDIDLTSWWKLSINTRAVQAVRKFPNFDNEGSYKTMIHQIIRTHPQQYLKSPNGYYSALSRIPAIENGVEDKTERGLIQRFATEITPLKNWKINADYSIDFKYVDFNNVKPTAYDDLVDGTLSPIATTVPNSIAKYKNHTLYQSLNIYTSYDWDIKDHHFTALAGFQQESNSYDYLQGSKKDMITPEVPSITTATGDITLTDNMTHWSTQGYFARLNYNYKGKYLFEANARYDGTSRFARGNRWGLFPSFSAGWNVSHEDFWKPLESWINSFKIRGSWGRLGNQQVTSYQDLPLLDVNSRLSWIINSKRPPYVTGPALVNTNLTWETSETIDVGVDLGFLKNRLQLSADYYQRLTFDKLGPARALPAVLGAVIPQENNTELRTRGWDLSFTWRDKIGKDFSYSATAMLFDYTNVITKYNNPTGTLSTSYKGKKNGEIWGYETVGLIQTQEEADEINKSGSQKFINAQEWKKGDVIYKDLNGDNKIDKGKNTVDDHGDLRVIGNTTPRYQFGLTLTADYKGFDLRAFFQGTGKRDLWITGNMFWGFNAWNQSSLFTHHMDYYRDGEGDTYSGLGVNTNAYYPRPYSNTTQYAKNQQTQSRYLQNGAYIRLKNLQVGYTFPKSLLKKIYVQQLRLYVSAENIWTITSLPKGFDPETANIGYYGNGKSMFTQAVYSVGFNLSF